MSSTSEVQRVFDAQRSYKQTAKNTDANYRLRKLGAFKQLLLDRKAELAQALQADFGKPQIESDLTELMPVISMINLHQKKLRSWMKPKKVKTPLLFSGTKSWVRHEGRGNCLIISPWNYPFQLAAYPILSAFAAGNTCIVKPSEYTPNTNRFLVRLFGDVFTQNEVAFFEGDGEISQKLLNLPFDHVFFTGSTAVGAIVAEAAAKNLASVSLELGGKSPCVVDRKVDLERAAEKIAWGKVVNAGQTCVAPDYLLVYEDQLSAVSKKLSKSMAKFFPDGFSNSPDANQIITDRHGRRLAQMVDEALAAGAVAICGGKYHRDKRLMEPTILTGVTMDMAIMREEIFGPVLPIISTKNKEEMLELINAQDNALATYIFSKDQSFADYFINNTFSGGVTLNDTLIGVGHPLLPFGGAGKSGIGKYHGKYGFDEFSNQRPVLSRRRESGLRFFYPPYSKKSSGIIDWLLRRFSSIF